MPGYNTALTGDIPTIYDPDKSKLLWALRPRSWEALKVCQCPAAEQVFSGDSELQSVFQQIDTT